MKSKHITNEEDLKYDDILDDIGGFGWYQKITLLFLMIPCITRAMIGSEYVFTTASIPYRCLIPACDETQPEYQPSWLSVAIPSNKNKLDSCTRYSQTNTTNQTDDGSVITSTSSSGVCPDWLFDLNRTEPCIDGYVYEKTNTMVYEFQLECSEWKRVAVGSYRNMAMIFGQMLNGFISDRFGRKKAILIFSFNQIIISIIRYFSVNYEMYVIFQVLDTALGVGMYPSSIIMASELVTPKWRATATILTMSFSTVGHALDGIIAWLVQYWRSFMLTLTICQLLNISLIWCIDESARWLINKKKFKEARRVITKISIMNSKPMSKETQDNLEKLIQIKENEIQKKETNQPNVVVSYREIFKSKTAIRLLCTVPIWWFTTKFVSYGMSLNSITLNGNMYLNFILVYLIEIPGYFTSMYTLQYIGRKKSLSLSYIICGLCCFTYIAVPSEWVGASLSLYFVGKFFISVVAASLYTYTSELYPTRLRQSFMGFSSGLSRIATSLSPLTPALAIYWTPLPMLLFGITAFISGLLLMTTPETTNVKLPDTFKEVEDLKT